MENLSRRRFVGGAMVAVAAGIGIAPRRASAAEFSFKYGHDVPATHPLQLRMEEAAKKILEESGGRLELRLFPNNQLGGDTDMLAQLRSGALESMSLSGNLLSTLTKVTSVMGVGFAFANHKQVWAAMDGELGAHMRSVIEKFGLRAMDKMSENGFRQITSSTRPIGGPDDLKGFKIRVPVSPQWTSLFKALGASPTSMNFSETYSALQTKIVDGQENALPLIEIAKLYEVQKYCSITNHMWDGFFNLVNARAWAKLPKNLQEILARNLDSAALNEREDLAKLNQTVEEKLKGHGMVFNRADTGAFRPLLSKAGYYKQWKETYGPETWAILEKYTGPLG
jgi:tripartite ATP-independent transporter DctP family solute receptor